GAGDAGRGSTCRVAVCGPNAQAAVISTGVGAATGSVVMTKVALLAPPGTVTLAGTTAAAGLLLVRESTSPPAPAGCASVTRPLAVVGRAAILIGAGPPFVRAGKREITIDEAVLVRRSEGDEVPGVACIGERGCCVPGLRPTDPTRHQHCLVPVPIRRIVDRP